MPSRTSILIIGGGPAGSVAATLLAQAGFQVALVEKHVGPRYHIGESLLPSVMEIFRLIGAKEKVDAYGFVRKEGGFFDWGGEQWSLNFSDRRGGIATYSYQVVRSELDYLLLNHARSEGVACFEGREITAIMFNEQGRPYQASWVEYEKESQASPARRGEMSFDFLIDASGRAGLMSTRYLNNRRFHHTFRNVALWGYWANARHPEGPRGAIGNYAITNGWLWGIPLHNGTLSLGLVLHKDALQELLKKRENDRRSQEEDLKELYLQGIARSQAATSLVEQATLVSPLKRETDYSYTARQFCGSGFFLVGDAACFLDPLLSTGLHLATFSSLLAAACLISLDKGEIEEEESLHFFDTAYRYVYLRLLALVSAFYQQHHGTDAYFREAQKLSQVDYDSKEIMQAFIGIVSGVEDLEDVQQRGVDQERLLQRLGGLVHESPATLAREGVTPTSHEIEREKARGQEYRNIFSFTPATAIRGLYLSTEPLGLTREPIQEAAR